MTDLVTAIMIFSIPIIAIVTSHYRKQTKIKHEILRDEMRTRKNKTRKLSN